MLALRGFSAFIDRKIESRPLPPPPPSARGRYVQHWERRIREMFQDFTTKQKLPWYLSFFPYGDVTVLMGLCGLIFLCLFLDIQGYFGAERFVRPLVFSMVCYPIVRFLWLYVALSSGRSTQVKPKARPQVLKRLGSYDLLEEVGAGAFGTVYRAVDRRKPDEEVAVKEMHMASGSQLESLRQSFDREQKVLSWLDHPGIVGRREFFADGQSLVLVMEFVHGLSLRQLLQGREKPLSAHVVLPIAESVCSALVHLHSQKPQPIVFRDLKPSNVLVDALGNVKLVDFGICRVVSGAPLNLPSQTSVTSSDCTEVLGRRGDTLCLGTPGYAAPEQYPDSPCESDPRADVYALGVVMWELLTGQRPSKKPRQLPPLRIYQSAVPEEVQLIVDRATALTREERYTSSRMMLLALQDALAKHVDDEVGFVEFAETFESAFRAQKKESLLPDSALRRAITKSL